MYGLNTSYGKVYIVKRTTCKDGRHTNTQKHLSSVSFCNIDYKLYSDDGSLSPLNEQYSGRPFSIQLKLNQEDQMGKPIELDAKFKIGYKLGELPPMPFEELPTHRQKSLDWMKSVGILSSSDGENDVNYRILEKAQGPAMAAALFPRWKLSELGYIPILSDAFFILDEHTDNGVSCNNLPFKTNHTYCSAMTDVLKGRDEELSEVPAVYQMFGTLMRELRNEILKKGKVSGKYAVRSLKRYTDATALENCREWKQQQRNPSSLMYLPTEAELRLICGGSEWVIETALFYNGITIPDKLRESFLYNDLHRVCAQHVCSFNDVVSSKKEMAQGTTSNKVISLHVNDGLELEQALIRCIDETNRINDILNETGDLFIDLFSDFEEARQVVTIFKDFVYGNIQWSSLVSRYHSNLVYDCVIEME